MAAKKIVQTPALKKSVAKSAPIDTTGMDPEMKKTLTAERNRKGAMNKAFSPFAGLGFGAKKAKPAAPKKGAKK